MIIFDKFPGWEQEKGENPEDILLIWRKRIFLSVFIITLIMACIPSFLNVQIAIASGKILNAVTISSIFVVAVVVTFGKFIPFETRAWSGLVLFYLMGVFSLTTLGLIGSGRILLFMFAVLTTLILGLRSGIIALSLNTLTMFLWIWGCFNNYFSWGSTYPFSPSQIQASGFTFLFCNSVATISLGFLVTALKKGFDKEQTLSNELKGTNEKLLRENEERKRTQDALKESEQKYRLLAENVNDMIWLMDIEHQRVTYISPSVEKMRGYTPAEVMAQSLDEILTPKSYERALGILADELAGDEGMDPERSVTMELEQYRKDGSTIWTEIVASIVRDSEKRPIAILGITRNITERKEAEEALRESEERLKLALDSVSDAIWDWRVDTGEVYFSSRWYTMLGYDPYELPQAFETWRELLHPDDLSNAEQMISRHLKSAKPFEMEFRMRTKNNQWRWILARGRTVEKDSEGNALRMLGTHLDLTDRIKAEKDKKSLEKQLQNAQKMEALGTLAGGIAHDFNNLLMAIQSRTSIMLMNKGSSHPDLEHLKGIAIHVESATDLTKQLLGFARGGKYEVKATDLNKLIKKENRMFGRTKKEITIREELEEALWFVEVDRGQIQQVLLNLYINAWQAMSEGGNLYVKTENMIFDENNVKPFAVEPGRYVKITITDTGIGMDKATQERIFDPFFTTKESGRGTGLGLASAYGIIKNHGGVINVYSEKGEGATFNIYLPASENKVVMEKKTTGHTLKGSETVLFVDDEDMVTEVAEDLLNLLGYKTLVARNGRETIEIYEENKNRISMVILDMIMPDISGGEVYDRLKKINPKVKVLLSSGYSTDGRVNEILNRGCNGFIQKPYNMKALSQKLREILDEK